MCSVAIDPTLSALHEAFWACAAVTREPKWLTERRTTAMEGFIELGLSTRQDEAWRFTDLRPLITAEGLPAPAPTAGADLAMIAANRLPGQAHRIVLVNGCVAPDLSEIGTLPPSVWFASVADTIDLRPDLIKAAFDVGDMFGAQPLASLNAAFFADGFVLAVDPGVTVSHPFEILHVSDAASRQAYHMRSVILAGAGSYTSVVETFVGTGPGWTNAVTTVDVGAKATLRHVKIQAEGTDSIHLAVCRARLAETARYDGFALICGARLSRLDLYVTVAGDLARRHAKQPGGFCFYPARPLHCDNQRFTLDYLRIRVLRNVFRIGRCRQRNGC
jgi:Fe-S cluster assembly protein SufD